eukprot:TRINITY_DN5577_c0_g2_i2.p1 TRINITY_DN5577_c0_g2~~TRINITY_DN5577_c0_g2_i2.p1  ORF type:complete len:139 (+),score=10.70 TRINITY_DN5577_c0_g2_i2:629-1045(+)
MTKATNMTDKNWSKIVAEYYKESSIIFKQAPLRFRMQFLDEMPITNEPSRGDARKLVNLGLDVLAERYNKYQPELSVRAAQYDAGVRTVRLIQDIMGLLDASRGQDGDGSCNCVPHDVEICAMIDTTSKKGTFRIRVW